MTYQAPSGRSRRRYGPASRPPAGPLRTCSPSSRSACARESSRSSLRKPWAKPYGPSSTTDIAAGTVTADQLARLRQRGCLIVRGHFDRRLPALLATLMPDGSPQMTQTRVGTDGERVVINPVQGQRYLGAPCPWYGGRDQA